MKYYRLNGNVHAFPKDGTQDHLITVLMIPMSPEEVDRHCYPEKYYTAKQKRQAYLENLDPITKRQFKLVLLDAGLLDKVQTSIDSIEDPIERMRVQIEYEDAQTFSRLNPAILTLSTAMGLKESQVDILWEKALKL